MKTANIIRRMKVVVVLGMLCGGAFSKAAEVKDLRTEYRTNPLGIEICSPRLSWIITSDRRGEIQTAYELLVASTAQLLAAGVGDLWDSRGAQ